MSNDIRWRWHLLALVPGLLSNLISVSLLLLSMNARNNPDWVAQVGTGLLWTGLCLPLTMPFYAYFVGRGYVRAFAGFKSAIPFAILYSAANFALWLGGIALVVANVSNFR
jgi:hypothetical protein